MILRPMTGGVLALLLATRKEAENTLIRVTRSERDHLRS